jgi:hypothetical protein
LEIGQQWCCQHVIVFERQFGDALVTIANPPIDFDEVEIGETADWCGKTVEGRDYLVTFFIRHPLLKPLRSSARWPALAAMMNLPADARY